MIKIALIRETKIPADNRVALTPAQCKWLQKTYPQLRMVAQYSQQRCFSDKEYSSAGIALAEDLSDCDMLMGIKEVAATGLLSNKTYLFFSHTKKAQPQNRHLLQAIVNKKNTLIDFECLEHSDGQRIIGFGFFAGIVGAHNGMMAYGNRTHTYNLSKVHQHKTFRKLLHTYFGLKLPTVKIAVTGSGRVAHGILEIMNLMQIREVEKEDFLEREFEYPVYVHLKGSDLYRTKEDGRYNRAHFHQHPQEYKCEFLPFAHAADILMNGVYWDKNIPPLFNKEDITDSGFRIQVIADVTDDAEGSVPINIGDQTIQDPVYGIDRNTFQKTAAYLLSSVDVMAVGNLPNELPRDASRYFGEQLIKYVIPHLLQENSVLIAKATLVNKGILTPDYEYLTGYVKGID